MSAFRFDRVCRQRGARVRGGKVTVRAEMTCPDYMTMFTKRLQEASPGTYSGRYGLVMPGQWTFHIVVRSKADEATTSALPVTVIDGS